MSHYRPLFAAVLSALILAGCSPSEPQPAPPEETSPVVETSISNKELPETPPQEVSTEPVGWEWFDDAVFIGDSVSLKLKNYVTKQRQSAPDFFGQAQFLTSGSLGSANALWEISDQSVHPSYQGTKMLLEEAVPLTGAKKVYLMLGMNDVGLYGVDDSVSNLDTLIQRIQAQAPDTSIYIQSATPICEGAEKKSLNNAALEEYNRKLSLLCEEKGYAFVDVASVMRDEHGFLVYDYCSDPEGMGIHFTDKACDIWMEYLLADAQTRAET